jgi:hypothetical protein
MQMVTISSQATLTGMVRLPETAPELKVIPYQMPAFRLKPPGT